MSLIIISVLAITIAKNFMVNPYKISLEETRSLQTRVYVTRG